MIQKLPAEYPSADAAKVALLTVTGAIDLDADTAKLAGIASGATANSTDDTLRARSNHTGTQAASTISDFDTEVGNNAAVTANTAKNSYPSGDSSKLAAIDTGATANSTDAALRARSSHTGTQTAATISDIQATITANASVAALLLLTTRVDKGTVTSSPNVDWTDGNHQNLVAGADITLTFTDPDFDATTLTLTITQDATGGRTVILPSMLWPRGVAPTLSTAANARDEFSIKWDGTNYSASYGPDFS